MLARGITTTLKGAFITVTTVSLEKQLDTFAPANLA